VRRSFDVLVAGGGPAGSTAAMALCRSGWSVALVEEDDYKSFRVGETLPPMIRPKLATLGVWERFLECEPLESYGIQTAWETAMPRRQEFIRNPYGCGWHVERARFDGMLATAAAAAGAELVVSARVSSCRRGPEEQWLLECTRNGTSLTLSGRLLVDATGRRALLAGRLGAHPQAADRLIGAVALSERHETEQWTLIEAIEQGWWYSAPLPGERTVFACMTDADLWKEAKWQELLKSAPLTFQRAGGTELPPPLAIVSAATLIRRPVTGPGWLAVGDAALAYDPLSGQGVLKSMDTGSRGASALARHLDGDPSGLAEYESWVEAAYREYLATRSQFYGSVQRWPASRFWKRRAVG
jgi:flavin-dependent dehydrogenase